SMSTNIIATYRAVRRRTHWCHGKAFCSRGECAPTRVGQAQILVFERSFKRVCSTRPTGVSRTENDGQDARKSALQLLHARLRPQIYTGDAPGSLDLRSVGQRG